MKDRKNKGVGEERVRKYVAKITYDWNKLKNRIGSLRIGFKITFAYFIIILLTVVCSSVIFQQASLYSARQRVSEVSVQTLSSVESGINLMFEDVNNYSKMIFSDDNLQNLLRGGGMYSNLQNQAQVDKYLYNMLQTTPLIDSISIFDNGDNTYSVGKKMPPTILIENVQDAAWYDEVVGNKGAYLLSLNADGAFLIQKEGNFISLIRQIRDIDTSIPLGILAIDISEDSIRQSYDSFVKDTAYRIVVLDKNGNSLIQSDDEAFVSNVKAVLLEHMLENKSGFMTYKISGTQYLMSYISQTKYGWTYISIMPFGNVGYENTWLMLIALAILGINGVIMFISSVAISKTLTIPINKLLGAMRKVETGSFQTIAEETGGYEFKKLFIGYNLMIGEIEQLIARVVEEQNIIRKTELNVLQAQIKPHFLYNTLDSVLSLSYSGENKKACELIEALESYYRLSVSKGQEIVTIAAEVELVKNYLIIQKIRYPKMFDVIYEIEENCFAVPMLKLVLQPLVENALYHGIREKGTKGTITISAKQRGEIVLLSVADDGVGMDDDTIQKIFNRKADENRSFGLWGTLERVRIYCNKNDCVKVESDEVNGTKITIML
ncbi:sensor histidine kinase [Lachnospiraceae bacterium ZAX-1]